MTSITEAKKRLPLPALLDELGLAKHAKKSALCPIHDDHHNSFSTYRRGGSWRWKCHAGCGQGDEITFLECYKNISNKEAINLFLEMAGANGATLAQPSARKRSTKTEQRLFDWTTCVDAFTDKHVEQLAKWRGYSVELCCWLKQNRLVGLHNGHIGFPVRDRIGKVVAVHYRLKSGSWAYHPEGTKVRPLVIGELVPGDPIHIFESYFDACTFMDKSGERTGIIITRGAGNGALVAGLVSTGATVYAWKQNDELKKGKRAGDGWLNAVAEHADTKVLWPQTPKQFKDLNEWAQNGDAQADDLLHAIEHAIPVKPFACEVSKPAEVSEAKQLERLSSPTNQKRPMIVLPGGSYTITTSATELFKLLAPSHSVFRRGKVVVTLVRNMIGNFVLEPLRPSSARSFFERFADFFAWRTGKDGSPVLKPVIIPEETARAFIDCAAAAELLPAINGLVNCPILTETSDGLVVCGEGFNLKSGVLVQNGEIPRIVPFDEAVRELRRLLAEFRFQSASDESRATGAIITPAMKMGNLLRDPIPIDVAEADRSQSGKTYRQKMTAAIYNEEPVLVPLKRGGVGSIDESFFAKLVNGRPFIQFDNYRGALDSPALEAFLTATGSYPCRIPHCQEIEVDPSRFFVGLTSNGVETTRDLANRSSIVRIFKRANVQFPDTLGMIRSRQPYYLGCIFAIVRKWHLMGKPRSSETRHDFREWCQTLDWIVQNLFGMAPLMDGHIAAQERVSNPTLTFLRRLAFEAERVDNLDTPLQAFQLFQLAEDADIQVPGLREQDQHDGDKAKKIIGIKLAPIFKDAQIVELDGFTVTRTESTRQRDDDGGDYVVKTYTFAKLPHQPAATMHGS